MSAKRYVIVNADDFGQSLGVNRGIVAAHEQGVVTSTSLMVRWSAAAEAAAYARDRPRLSVGLHVDFGEWACRGGEWVRLYQVVPAQDAGAVAAELTRQLETFERLMGRPPTHLDSHQHAHRDGPLRSLVLGAGERLGVPVRHFSPEVHYCGRFYGQDEKGTPWPQLISPAGLIALLRELPPGVTELGCHPGEGEDLDTMYRGERALEVRTLCDPEVRAALDELRVQLCSFSDYPRLAAASPAEKGGRL